MIVIAGLAPIDTPGMTALNSVEILIFGGTDTKLNRPNNVCILNLSKKSLMRVAPENTLPINPQHH